jgi:uncharacterized membrane protein YgcG
MKHRWLIVVLGVVAAGTAVALLWPSDDDDATDAAAPPEEDPLVEDGLAFFFDDDVGPGPAEGEAADEARDFGDGRREEWRRMDPEERRERRRAWREKMRNMTPEERRARLSRRIRIESLADAPATLEPEDVAESMRDSRRAARDCLREHGGFRALREAMGRTARSDAGRSRFRMSFEVGADGTVAPDSVAMDPAPPSPFYDCFAQSIAQTSFPPAGADGASVELDLGRGGRGGGGGRDGRGGRARETSGTEGGGTEGGGDRWRDRGERTGGEAAPGGAPPEAE